MTSIAVDTDALRAAEQFLYREARLCDQHRFREWESLWTDDAIYWVPANGDDTDPTRQMSVLFDNRSRIATRVRQLESGKRHAQSPPSRLARLVANVELLADDRDELTVASVFTIHESRTRGTTVWAGRYEHVLRRTAPGLRMVRKTARLVDNDRAIPTLAFLI
jgi:3-phenylpropionate/cinnamic acid dioxygenase small subunit